METDPRPAPGRFVVVPASYLFLLREGERGTEVLLQLRGDVPYMADHWAAGAAGHVERGETAFDAIRREAREELGLDEVAAEFAFTMQRTRGGEAIDERVDFFFTAREWNGSPRITEPEKAHDLGWFALSDLPATVVPHERYALTRLFEPVGYLSYGFEPDEARPEETA